MASRLQLKRRIRSIKNTAQITKAQQMIAASRMRRAQQRVAATRPYAENIREIVADVSGRSGAEEHPLLAHRDVRSREIILITPDRGLAGPLVTTINRELIRTIRSEDVPARVVAVGRKGRDFVTRYRLNLVAEFTGLGDHPGAAAAGPIAQEVLDDFREGRADIVYLLYTQFISTLRQRPKLVQLLPVVPPEDASPTESPWSYEPDNPARVLSELLPRYVEFTIYQAILESIASEHSARMIAMSSATDNANELVADLTLLYNKARQAEITKEIAEISGAAEAIRTG